MTPEQQKRFEQIESGINSNLRQGKSGEGLLDFLPDEMGEAPDPVQTDTANPPVPVDVLASHQRAERQRPNLVRGNSKRALYAVAKVFDKAEGTHLKEQFNRFRDMYRHLLELGGVENAKRASQLNEQYRMDYVIPTIEVVVNMSSPDELLANRDALAKIDQYASLVGSGKGYTENYLYNAYGNVLGQVSNQSDDEICQEMCHIDYLLDTGSIRDAVGLARGLKDQIDRGERMADDNIYEKLGRIVAFSS